jgi:hypothetical protein
MNIEKLVCVIRSLAQLDSYDSQCGVLNLAQLAWQSEGLHKTGEVKYWRDFERACTCYLRTYQAQLASDKAQGIVICLYTDGIIKTTQFPSPTDWDKCLSAAAADIYTAYGECVNENGTGSRQLTGRAAKDSPSDNQVLDTLMGAGFTNGTGAWASKRKTPRSSAKGGSK